VRVGSVEQAYSRCCPFGPVVDRPGDAAHRQLRVSFMITCSLRAANVKFTVTMWPHSKLVEAAIAIRRRARQGLVTIRYYSDTFCDDNWPTESTQHGVDCYATRRAVPVGRRSGQLTERYRSLEGPHHAGLAWNTARSSANAGNGVTRCGVAWQISNAHGSW